MRYPKALGENGTIGFVAPSFGCTIEPYRSAFDNAQKTLREKGHSLVLGPNCYAEDGIGISSTPKNCGQELTESYLSPDSDVLISCGGGELMCEILDEIDWDQIKKAEPKWFMGSSDNTNFTFLLPTLCDTAAVYGPCAASFGMEPWHEAISDAYELLLGKRTHFHSYSLWEKESLKEENPLSSYNVTEQMKLQCFQGNEPISASGPIQMEGRLIGGCLDCLSNLVGTVYDKVEDFNQRYYEDGFIWFLESCDLNVLGIRRALWQLKHAGWFENVKGFLIGRPLCFGEELMGLDQYHAVVDVLGAFEVPIIQDIDIGHLPPMIPMISGGRGSVTVKDNRLDIQYR